MEEQIATIEEMKAKAVERLIELRYYKPSKEAFRRSNKIMVNEPPFGAHFCLEQDNYPELYEECERLKSQYGCLPYAVTHEFFEFGECFSILVVSKYKEDWVMEDELIKDGIVYAYVFNKSIPEYSEFGSVQVRPTVAGGIQRIS